MQLVEPSEQWRAAFLDMARDCNAAGDYRYDLTYRHFKRYFGAARSWRRGPL